MRLRTLQIIVLRQNKTDPRGIIERLIEERKQMKQNQEWSHKDSAWAVFDGDEHIEQSVRIQVASGRLLPKTLSE
ncbi:hypothetical protein RIVM261_001430 [Rivularia sp. IAM M-261]|nr:hypothetical protein RIVM261_001430 [Rivularia sp. IAM M-261]